MTTAVAKKNPYPSHETQLSYPTTITKLVLEYYSIDATIQTLFAERVKPIEKESYLCVAEIINGLVDRIYVRETLASMVGAIEIRESIKDEVYSIFADIVIENCVTKVLFLDIDGSLVRIHTPAELDQLMSAVGGSIYELRVLLSNEHFGKVAIENLDNLLKDDEGVAIVLSSFWRKAHSVIDLREMFSKHRFAKLLIHKTCSVHKTTRGWQIHDFLLKHPKIIRYAILDDQDDSLSIYFGCMNNPVWFDEDEYFNPCGHFVKVNPYFLITAADARKAEYALHQRVTLPPIAYDYMVPPSPDSSDSD